MQSCPVELKPYDTAHKKQIEEKNMMLWLNGRYISEAIMSTIGNSPWFKAETAPAFEYPEKPYLLSDESDEMSEDEKKREVDKFFAQESARRANWRRTHPEQVE